MSYWQPERDPCHFVKDRSVPGGRYLVPGCWSRAVAGDRAACHCDRPPRQKRERAPAPMRGTDGTDVPEDRAK